MKISKTLFNILFNLIVSIIMSFVMSLVQTVMNAGLNPAAFPVFIKGFLISIPLSFLVIYPTIPFVSKWLNRHFEVVSEGKPEFSAAAK